MVFYTISTHSSTNPFDTTLYLYPHRSTSISVLFFPRQTKQIKPSPICPDNAAASNSAKNHRCTHTRTHGRTAPPLDVDCRITFLHSFVTSGIRTNQQVEQKSNNWQLIGIQIHTLTRPHHHHTTNAPVLVPTCLLSFKSKENKTPPPLSFAYLLIHRFVLHRIIPQPSLIERVIHTQYLYTYQPTIQRSTNCEQLETYPTPPTILHDAFRFSLSSLVLQAALAQSWHRPRLHSLCVVHGLFQITSVQVSSSLSLALSHPPFLSFLRLLFLQQLHLCHSI